MKSIRSSKRSIKRQKSKDERKGLIDSQTKHQSYVQETDTEFTDGDSEGHKSSLKRSATLPPLSRSPATSPSHKRKISEIQVSNHKLRDSPPQNGNGDTSQFLYPSGKALSPPPSPSLPKSPKSPSRQSSDELTRVEYEKLPFNFYIRNAKPWKDVVSLTALLISLSLFVPSLIILVVTIVLLKRDVKGIPVQRKKKTVYCYVMLASSIIRDIIIIIVVIPLGLKVPIHSPVLTYPVLLFFWFMCPVAVIVAFSISETKYAFQYNSNKENRKKLLRHFSIEEIKEAEINKADVEEKYFADTYPLIAAICSWADEYTYLKSVLKRKNVVISIVFCVLVCVARFLLVLGLEVSHRPVYYFAANTTTGLNQTDSHPTQPRAFRMYVPCTVILSLLSLLLSFIVSAFLMYALLWSVAIFREWKYFNENEDDDKKTVINRGPQAIAVWWKIRETLNLFSSYSICFSVCIGKCLFVTSTVIVVLMSMNLIRSSLTNTADDQRSSYASLVVDNVLLYSFNLIQCILYNLIQRERMLSTQALQLKKLNIGYEIACFVNLGPEGAEREAAARSRIRFLRGRVALLDDLLVTVVHIDDNSRLTVVNISSLVAGFAVLISTVYSLR